MTKTWCGVAALVCLVGVCAVPFTGAAQEAEAPPWVQMTIVHVDPAMVDEFMAVQRELMARAKEDGTPWRRVSRTAVFGNTYRFLIATPVENFAGFDRADAADAELTALIGRVQRCITSRQSYAVRTLAEIDNPLPEDQEPDLMVINLTKVTPGREQDYLSVLTTDVLPHFTEAEMHHVTGALTFGGEGGFVHLFYVDDFAALDQGSPVLRVLGPDGAQAVTAKLSGIVTSTEQWLVRLLPEISYGPSSDTEQP